MSENREPQIMLYFTDEVFRRNHVITSRTCKRLTHAKAPSSG